MMERSIESTDVHDTKIFQVFDAFIERLSNIESQISRFDERLTDLETRQGAMIEAEKYRLRTKYGDFHGHVFGIPYKIWRGDGSSVFAREHDKYYFEKRQAPLYRSRFSFCLEDSGCEWILDRDVSIHELRQKKYRDILARYDIDVEELIYDCERNYSGEVNCVWISDLQIDYDTEVIKKDDFISDIIVKGMLDEAVDSSTDIKEIRLETESQYALHVTMNAPLHVDEGIKIFIELMKSMNAPIQSTIEVCDTRGDIDELGRTEPDD